MVRKKTLAFAVLLVVTTGSLLLGGWAAQDQQEQIDDHDAGVSDEPEVIEETVDGHVSTYAYRAEVPTQGCMNQNNPAVVLPLVPGSLGTCGGGFIPFVPWKNARGSLNRMDEDTQVMTLEMVWGTNGSLGENLRLVVVCSEAESTQHPCYHEAPGRVSPLEIEIHRSHMEAKGVDMDQNWYWFVQPGWGMVGTYDDLGVDVGASFQQEYTITFRYFQNAVPKD